VSGADPVTARPGFLAMLQRLAGNGIRTIIIESPDRFTRDLAVQLAGHDMLKGLGIDLIPASAPDFFLEDMPTAGLVRQVLGAIAQFEKASLVAKLKAARDRKRARDGKCEGRLSHREMNPKLVALAKKLHRRNHKTGERKSS
jgi:DNA invertase Pin-like site-specific DNA recombinase